MSDDRIEGIGERIRLLRNAKGLTQTELAQSCGVTKSAVSNWECGRCDNIRMKPLIFLLDTLGTSLEYLVHGKQTRARRHNAGDGLIFDRRRDPG